ncbi:hypothetical protein NE237_014393 [Protea cynaroides]|uniref:C2 domain-containing protein n=1 Tax=Protea cynaroides TaxID=273540 RepID=A0A9Q0QQ15_9MAGN|nr:hypothetical protein NE237_014393 [Protea cynaroides]
MAALRSFQSPAYSLQCFCSPSVKLLLKLRNRSSTSLAKVFFTGVAEEVRVSKLNRGGTDGKNSVCCFCKSNSEVELESSVEEESEGPPFDINLAVVLAGFAFEAYRSPPENIGRREVDAGNCQTVFLSEFFVREVYDGQLFLKLKKGVDFPAMDPWGTSDPYVVMQFDEQVVKSKVKWGTKEPTWNEEFILNIKLPPTKILQVAAWDANLVTPHKRMGNAGINLEAFCDGNLHEVLVELEGMGGGGRIYLEVNYKSFEEIDREKQWWQIPFVSNFLGKNGFKSALKMIVGSETVQARQFVEYAFGQLKSFNDAHLLDQFSNKDIFDVEGSGKSENQVGVPDKTSQPGGSPESSFSVINYEQDGNSLESETNYGSGTYESSSFVDTEVNESMQSEKYFWKNFADITNRTIVEKLGIPIQEKIKWDGFDLLNRIGLQSRKIAEARYVESGLATPKSQDNDGATTGPTTISAMQSSFPDIKKASSDLLRQTESILGALMVLTAAFSQKNMQAHQVGKKETGKDASTTVQDGVSGYPVNGKVGDTLNGSVLDQRKAEEMKSLFSTAESAMEAWAMLATSLGHPSFIKSEFEKICFLDNTSTDTQVAIWRDTPQKRLVVAFRGTEQVKWKDLRTDLMLAPTGLNPERLGGDFKQEVQVHSGFLSAFDSVRTRIMSLIKEAIGFVDGAEVLHKWHIYVTGHSLGGALATLLALELSSGQLAKCGAISVTMYNFGSPRVGNKKFAEIYNEKVKDSWRVVNHRDIIPTVPRLMGYCHVANPVYLAAGELTDALENMGLMGDGYQGDIIGECTPDVIVSEFMKGEKELIEKILQAEINMYRSIRDGSALMQHMEDFYYITLLENVRSNYQTVESSNSISEDSISVT